MNITNSILTVLQALGGIRKADLSLVQWAVCATDAEMQIALAAAKK